MKRVYLSISALLFVLVVSVNSLYAQDSIHVRVGWNLVGATSTRNASSIVTKPAGIVTSSYFGYFPGPGYQQTDTLHRGYGYWVKVNQDGLIIVDSSNSLCGEMVSYEGRFYRTIQIGGKCWFLDNLDIGTMIAGSTSPSDNGIIEKNCYNDDSANCVKYGGLYQWNEAMGYSLTPGVQGICPTGWHLPTSADFQSLSAAVTDNANSLKAFGQGTGAGAGSNASGFSALLGGYWYGNFDLLGTYGFIWSSTQLGGTTADHMPLDGSTNSILTGVPSFKDHAFCLRCIKN